MYSYPNRIRAVEPYVKLGKRVRPTLRQLGYPTKNALKGWSSEYQQKLDLPAGYAGREPKFSQEQKAAAFEHYVTHDQSIAATIRALGFPGQGTLTAWIREALPEAGSAVVGSVGRRRYSGKLMQAGVRALGMREESAQAEADKFGVCRPTLYKLEVAAIVVGEDQDLIAGRLLLAALDQALACNLDSGGFGHLLKAFLQLIAIFRELRAKRLQIDRNELHMIDRTASAQGQPSRQVVRW